MIDDKDLKNYEEAGKKLLFEAGKAFGPDAVTIDTLWEALIFSTKSPITLNVSKDEFFERIHIWLGISHEIAQLNDMILTDEKGVFIAIKSTFAKVINEIDKITGKPRFRLNLIHMQQYEQDSLFHNIRSETEKLVRCADIALDQINLEIKTGISEAVQIKSNFSAKAWIELVIIWQWARGKKCGEDFRTFAMLALSLVIGNKRAKINSVKLSKNAIQAVNSKKTNYKLYYL